VLNKDSSEMKGIHSELTALCCASANGDKLFFHFDEKSGFETPRLDSDKFYLCMRPCVRAHNAGTRARVMN
jgi:hypothetical protein